MCNKKIDIRELVDRLNGKQNKQLLTGHFSQNEQKLVATKQKLLEKKTPICQSGITHSAQQTYI